MSEKWNYRKGVLGEDWGDHVVTLNGASMAETLNEESAKLICEAINCRPLQSQMEWISVDEGEEVPKGEILAFNAEYEAGHIHKALSDGRGYINETETIDAKRLYKVTYYMPLPNPPEAKK